MKSKNTCKKCNGSGYSNRKSVRCPCGKICTKCEKNEGFIVHPYEICDYCCGTGDLDSADMVLCLNRKKL